MTPLQRKQLHSLLLRLAVEVRPWAEAEEHLRAVTDSVTLAGDPLRPYVVDATRDRLTVSAVRRTGLPDPPLISDLLASRYGPPLIQSGPAMAGGLHCPDATVLDLAVASSQALDDRLRLPRVLLVGLGDRIRYRGARLPLGVARLASWLRFTHAAQVRVVDYSLTDGDALQVVMESLRTEQRVVGIGVNFGHWRMLADLAEVIDQLTASWVSSPVIVLGNILAAFSPRASAMSFERAYADGRVLVVTGLGERPMEELCRRLDEPESWARIPGVWSSSGSGGGLRQRGPLEHRSTGVLQAESVPSPVAPDDSLVLAVAAAGGQVSLETSLGCQYGACTFCPRQHRGAGWTREEPGVSVAILERFSRLHSAEGIKVALSIVDEEFFGAEGLQDPPADELAAARILACLHDLDLRYELYTRLEQLFDRRRSRQWNLQRASLLGEAAPHMRRLFVGVESGSPGQLRRYGKGQTVGQTVDALRVASALGVPLEFGFITFDPLLTPAELGENLAFLARADLMCKPSVGDPARVVSNYLDGADLAASGEPVYLHVAYMATELEVLANSRYADHLHRRHPALLDGYDPAFCRFGARYLNTGIASVAAWCRVWTEGMFTPVYRARMAVRSTGPESAADAQALVLRYRDATFALLCELTRRYLPDVKLDHEVLGSTPAGTCDEMTLLVSLSSTVTGHPVRFDPGFLEHHRDR